MAGIFQLVCGAALLGSWMTSEHFLPWVSWHSELPIFAAVLLVACLACVRQLWHAGLEAKALVPHSALVLVGLLALVVTQTVAGQIAYAGDGIIIGLYLLVYLMALLLGHAAVSSGDGAPRDSVDSWSSAEILAGTLLAGAAISALIALAQVTQVWETVGWIVRMPDARRSGANLAQPNQLATLLLMGLASAAYLYERSRVSAGFFLAAYLLLVIGLAATESRSGVLSYLVMTGWWFVAHKRVGAKLAPSTVAVATAVFLLLFWLWPPVMAALGIFAPGATVKATSAGRLEVWAQLAQAVLIHPWAGWGLREVSQAHNAVVHAYATSQPFTYAHNIVLDLMVGAGIPIALLLMVVIAKGCWHRMRSANTSLQWYCIAVALPLATHSMLEFPYAYAYLAVPALFLFGMLEASTNAPALKLPAGPLAIAAVSVTVLAAWTVVEYVAVEEDFRIVRFENLKVGRTPQAYERPKIHLLTQLDGLLVAGRIEPKPGMSGDALEVLRKAALRYPWPATQNRYAMALALNGEREEALRQLQVIRALHGQRAYLQIKEDWGAAASEKYPQLLELKLP